jgi:hypothetical protein
MTRMAKIDDSNSLCISERQNTSATRITQPREAGPTAELRGHRPARLSRASPASRRPTTTHAAVSGRKGRDEKVKSPPCACPSGGDSKIYPNESRRRQCRRWRARFPSEEVRGAQPSLAAVTNGDECEPGADWSSSAVDWSSTPTTGGRQQQAAAAAMVRPGSAEADARQQRPRPQLVGYEELPEYLQDNKFIRGHYRTE